MNTWKITWFQEDTLREVVTTSACAPHDIIEHARLAGVVIYNILKIERMPS